MYYVQPDNMLIVLLCSPLICRRKRHSQGTDNNSGVKPVLKSKYLFCKNIYGNFLKMFPMALTPRLHYVVQTPKGQRERTFLDTFTQPQALIEHWNEEDCKVLLEVSIIFKQETEKDLYLLHLFYPNLLGWSLHAPRSLPTPLPILLSHALLMRNTLQWELLLVRFAQVKILPMVMCLSIKHVRNPVRNRDQKKHQL